MYNLKQQLYDLCIQYLATREAQIKQIIAEAREAAANETKSSAGDKYETTREMMQQEVDHSLARLHELEKHKAALLHIDPTQHSSTVRAGSVVYTSNGNFYICISAGQLQINNYNYYAISAASPIGSRLMGKGIGHLFLLNEKEFLIKDII